MIVVYWQDGMATIDRDGRIIESEGDTTEITKALQTRATIYWQAPPPNPDEEGAVYRLNPGDDDYVKAVLERLPGVVVV